MWELRELPIEEDVESKKVLKRLPKVHRALAELKGIASNIPNQSILINTLALQEAKDSSAVENIITTHDELFKAELQLDKIKNLSAKEVQNYVFALKRGFDLVVNSKLLTQNHIIEIQSQLENNNAGFRKVPGTTLKNQDTQQIIYTPPQTYDSIKELMSNLEKFINDNELSDLDPLVKMAIIHHQFESIHPFYDGNGRTGRIINILYLVLNDLLNLPILYLSRYIIQNKGTYYELLQKVRDENSWEEWILYILDAIEYTSLQTIEIIKKMKALMMEYKKVLRDNYKFYSQDLLNNLFKHPYTKISFLERDLKVSRPTASAYINQLAKDGLLIKQKIGTTNYYINQPLFDILMTEK